VEPDVVDSIPDIATISTAVLRYHLPNVGPNGTCTRDSHRIAQHASDTFALALPLRQPFGDADDDADAFAERRGGDGHAQADARSDAVPDRHSHDVCAVRLADKLSHRSANARADARADALSIVVSVAATVGGTVARSDACAQQLSDAGADAGAVLRHDIPDDPADRVADKVPFRTS
jgi:hypothetical protein